MTRLAIAQALHRARQASAGQEPPVQKISFEGQVALITGAGRGLGRAYALELASRGAAVVVNNVLEADGRDTATEVAQEITHQGGLAIPSTASVTDEIQVAEMVAGALERWGHIDVLIANAGVLVDLPFAEMTLDQFRVVMDVHLMGTVLPVKAVWRHLTSRGYGRIVTTTSSSGVFGRSTQTNYAAAKMGIVGFSNAIRNEGLERGVRVNVISPMAHTRMTESLISADRLEKLDPAHVAAGVAYLASPDAPNGALLTAGAAGFALTRIQESEPIFLNEANLTAETVRDNWHRISGATGAQNFENGAAQATRWFSAFSAARKRSETDTAVLPEKAAI
jgi:NAD(P)-dependent dehydrogenase (short-subunit alcohol dehydrogenase family)